MNPWRTMWLRPRQTIRSVVSDNPNRSLWLLAAIYGFSAILNTFQSAAVGAGAAIWALVLAAIIISPLWGYVVFTCWSWFVSVAGRWIKGCGSFSEIRAAYAWSCVPLSANVVIWLFLIGFIGSHVFENFADGHLLSQWQVSVLFVLLLGKMAFVIWSIVLYLNALAEVQRFSVLKAIFNIIIAGVMVAAVVMVLYFLFMGVLHIKGVIT